MDHGCRLPSRVWAQSRTAGPGGVLLALWLILGVASSSCRPLACRLGVGLWLLAAPRVLGPGGRPGGAAPRSPDLRRWPPSPVCQPLSGSGFLAALKCRPSVLPRTGVDFRVRLHDSDYSPACWFLELSASVWPRSSAAGAWSCLGPATPACSHRLLAT